MNLDLLKQELIRDEGLRTTAYRDTMGLWTIGIGHLLPQDRDWTGTVWSLVQVQSAFQADVQSALAVLQSLGLGAALNTDARQRAVANMCFEMGHKLLTFTTFLSLLRQGKYKEAADDLKTTLWAKEVPARAQRIREMIANG